MVSRDAKQPLSFIFTKTGFILDCSGQNPISDDVKQYWKKDDGFYGLYNLGLKDTNSTNDSQSFLYLQQLAREFFSCLMDIPSLELARENVQVNLDDERIDYLLESTPFAIGVEYINKEWILHTFDRLRIIFATEISQYDGTVASYFTIKNQSLHVPERIFFHLVENKDDEIYPFAFVATYATKVNDVVKHFPLQYAMVEFKNDKEKLLNLLSCLNKAADVSNFVSKIMDSGELFHAIRLTANEAYSFLLDVENIEKTGVLCRIPNWWRNKSSSVALNIKLGDKEPSSLGFDAILSTKPELVVNGIPLTEEEVEQLLQQSDGLVLLKGKWVSVDKSKLAILLEKMKESKTEISLLEAIKMNKKKDEDQSIDIGVTISNGKWLNDLLLSLKNPSMVKQLPPPNDLHASLREYQEEGYSWLSLMDKLKFGACLADDMGLGKTVQVLAYLTKLVEKKKDARVLLIVPATLIGNWQAEIEKFSPKLDYQILHGISADLLSDMFKKSKCFLNITTYSMATRIKSLLDVEFDCIILDEAQAIKNPGTKQTRSIKAINAKMHIAMTGTPIENDLTNLWSLFDFLDKGLLGSSSEFSTFCKKLKNDPDQYIHLKNMVAPFMLRRLKTDKKIIKDLPDKLETVDYAQLSSRQVVLYRELLANLQQKLEEEDGIGRKGLILSTILKLKQICNHPDEYLGQDAFLPEESGKFTLLSQICETIYERRERVLVFTQFREMCQPLADFLKTIFHSEGLLIHGEVPISQRKKIVDKFQSEEYTPFMVLSVKAGGTGLNLTKANHVIHFDRWWNPAVENQATDRAFRIGQNKNVLVHKLVCKGTIEEKIDAMIESKKDLAEKVIGEGSAEKWITELSNEQLISILKLDGD